MRWIARLETPGSLLSWPERSRANVYVYSTPGIIFPLSGNIFCKEPSDDPLKRIDSPQPGCISRHRDASLPGRGLYTDLRLNAAVHVWGSIPNGRQRPPAARCRRIVPARYVASTASG